MPKTLPEKFFIKEGYEIAVLNAPQMFFTKQFTPLPKDATITTQLNQGSYDVIIAFVTTASETEHFLQPVWQAMQPGSFVWFCYPKGGSKAKITTDLNRDSLAELVMESGLRPVHQMSIDDTWSGLRFRAESTD
jgi:hypothetical protein